MYTPHNTWLNILLLYVVLTTVILLTVILGRAKRQNCTICV